MKLRQFYPFFLIFSISLTSCGIKQKISFEDFSNIINSTKEKWYDNLTVTYQGKVQTHTINYDNSEDQHDTSYTDDENITINNKCKFKLGFGGEYQLAQTTGGFNQYELGFIQESVRHELPFTLSCVFNNFISEDGQYLVPQNITHYAFYKNPAAIYYVQEYDDTQMQVEVNGFTSYAWVTGKEETTLTYNSNGKITRVYSVSNLTILYSNLSSGKDRPDTKVESKVKVNFYYSYKTEHKE